MCFGCSCDSMHLCYEPPNLHIKLDPILQLVKPLFNFSILLILPMEKFPHNIMFSGTIEKTF